MPTLLGVKEGSVSYDQNLEDRDGKQVEKGSSKLTYYVLADSLSDGEDEIFGTSGIPALFAVGSGGGRASKRTAKETNRVRHPNTGAVTALWEVDVSFSTDVDPEDEEDDPTLKPPEVRWHGETEEEVLEEDPITGEAIQTDAEEPILITTPIVLPVLEIKRYESYPFDPNTMLAYSHHTNSTAFWGAPTGSALFLPPEVDEETIDEIKYAVVTYRIKFKIKPGVAEPWKARVLHHGFKYRPNPGDPPKIYQDRTGNPATINLAPGGTKLPDGDPPNYKEFNRFAKANFNTLNLGPF